MKRTTIKNTSHWPDHFIRRMLRWCTAQVEVPGGPLKRATFRKRSRGEWSGHAYCGGRIVVSIGPVPSPVLWSGYKRACRPADGSDYLIIADQLEALIAVTAHELGHIAHFRRGHYGRGSEDLADARARYVLRMFREQRAALEAEWSAPPAAKPARPKPSPQEQRAAAALAAVQRWERKLRLAKTKLAKYRRRVTYYERKAACSKTDRWR